MAMESFPDPSRPAPHRWRFFRSGGFDQVRLETGADLMALDQLDQKLWAALSCPTKGLEFDGRTLELLDSDGDGRIRVSEMIAAVQWAGSLLKNPDDLIKGADDLPLFAIDETSPEGVNISACPLWLSDMDGAAISFLAVPPFFKSSGWLPGLFHLGGKRPAGLKRPACRTPCPRRSAGPFLRLSRAVFRRIPTLESAVRAFAYPAARAG
jgi:hypothetical protein